MAEPRRVTLTTLCSAAEASVPCPAPMLPQPVPRGPPPDQSVDDTGTFRLVLTLFESDEHAFPEFSYKQLLDDQKHTDDTILSRFEEEEKMEHDEMAAIARKLEEKYGNKPKKKKDRIQDLIDIGYGYDEEDSFIDNSEAYDEFVPASLTTKLGGFYVNSGALHFKQYSETEESTPAERGKKPAKKRKLNEELDKPQKICNGDSEVQGKLSSTSETVEENSLKKKKKKKLSTLSVTTALKRLEREKELERQRQEQAKASPRGMNTLAMGPADAAGGGGYMYFNNPLLSLIESTNEQALIQAASAVDSDLDLEPLLYLNEDSCSSHSLPQPDETVPPTIVKETKAEETHSKIQQTAQSTTSSTEGFPPGLEDSIHKLMVATKTPAESKVKFYTPEINSILLEIEMQCRPLGGPLRSRVYSHLSSFLPCNKETLLRREELADMDLLMKTLTEAIGKTMPEQILSWQENCGSEEPGQITKAEEEDSEEQGNKKGKGAKKQFIWNKEIRESLRRLLKLKVERYKKRQKGHNVEEYVKSVLENEVKGLWPKGWMTSRILLKEGRKLLGLTGAVLLKNSKKKLTTQNDAVPSDPAAPNPGHTGASNADPGPPPDPPIYQPTPVLSQELLAAAAAKYKQPVQRWRFTEDMGSPPLPPPPPQSSPINFPLTPPCCVVLCRLTPAQETTKN